MSTVDRCMRSCATGTTTIPNGMPTTGPSRRRGGTSRNGVVSRTLTLVGPNARLVGELILEGAMRQLKAGRDGEIEVAGLDLARSLTALGLSRARSHLFTPRRARSRQAILRRAPAAASPDGA